MPVQGTHFFGATSFYNGVTSSSARIDDDTSSYLSRTPSSAGNRRTFTFATWFKGHENGYFFSALKGSNNDTIGISGSNEIQVSIDNASSYSLTSNRLIRDPAAWYHLVWRVDSTQSTDSDRMRVYLNGDQITSWSTENYITQNYDFEVNNTVAHNIGRLVGGGGSYVGGYITETHLIDGQSLGPESFGETKNGVWIPRNTSGLTYGTNGFRLQFKQTGTGTASSSTIGADTSGQDNHYTSNNMGVDASNIPDCPENNFLTLGGNENRGNSNIVATLGNLKFTKSGANFSNMLGSFALFSGKWYCEAYITTSNLTQVGVQECQNTIFTNGGDFGANTDLGMWDSRGYYYDEGTAAGSPPSYGSADIIQIAFDVEAGKIWFGKNGTYNHSGDPANGTNQTTGSTNDLSKIGVTIAGNGENGGAAVYNCGQDGSFAGNLTGGNVGTESDENGIGAFKYAPPSGFLAICTANFPNVTVGGDAAVQADDNFNTVLYTGDGSGQGITGVGFQPDWVWIKSRSHASSHVLTDSSRGVTKSLFSDTTDAETTLSGGVTAFGTDGFTLGSEGTVNTATRTYVGWNWKANGGTTSTISVGDVSSGVPSIASTVQVNATAGFSIVLYTSNNTAGATVGHGLGVVPDLIITKNREDARNWGFYHHQVASDPETDNLFLNLSNAVSDDSAYWNDTAPTSTVFSLGTNGGETNYPSGDGYVAYCFTEIPGYSKFGQYVGNGANNGPVVYTGFTPAWVLIKNTARSADWRLHDIVRQPTNDTGGHILLPNSNSSEVTSEYDIDFLSNGFKLRSSDVYENGSGEKLIYMAFAKNPFKFSNAR